jgi:hypothetical protein
MVHLPISWSPWWRGLSAARSAPAPAPGPGGAEDSRLVETRNSPFRGTQTRLLRGAVFAGIRVAQRIERTNVIGSSTLAPERGTWQCSLLSLVSLDTALAVTAFYINLCYTRGT